MADLSFKTKARMQTKWHKDSKSSPRSESWTFTLSSGLLLERCSIAVLTSGGDSQGMNSVLFGLVHQARLHKAEVFTIWNGFKGLVDGGPDNIKKADYEMLLENICQGGSIIRSSRCREFFRPEGRKRACKNMLLNEIESLVVVGGDGSLTGANFLRLEWPRFVKELIDSGTINKKFADSQLYLVGIVGSIDNDFYGTEMTVGADSALTRIIEGIDTIKSTAKSHSRIKVIEVMGRNCGYLAMSAALACEVSFVFIPECPQENWQSKLLSRIQYERAQGLYHQIILVAEGACCYRGKPIKSEMIKDVLMRSDFDTRVMVLGHLQRGGQTSFFDRIMSLQMGIQAFEILKEKPLHPIMLVIEDGEIKSKRLEDCLNGLKMLNEYVKERKWNLVKKQRGASFGLTWENYWKLMQTVPASNIPDNKQNSWGIIVYGQPVPGVNSIIYAIVRCGIGNRCDVIGFRKGFEGVLANDIIRYQWIDVCDQIQNSGSILQSSMSHTADLTDDQLKLIDENLKKNFIKCLCFIGDHNAHEAMFRLINYRKKITDYGKDLKICYIPVSIRPFNLPLENVTWLVLGRDSILNKSMNLITDIFHSSCGTIDQLFFVRLNLNIISTTFTDLSSLRLSLCSILVYPKEKYELDSPNPDINEEMVQKDADKLKSFMLKRHNNQLILIHETWWSKVFPVFQKTFEDTTFICKEIDLSSVQLPASPSPYDRKTGVRLGMKCSRYFVDEKNKEPLLIVTNRSQQIESIRNLIKKSRISDSPSVKAVKENKSPGAAVAVVINQRNQTLKKTKKMKNELNNN